MMRPRLALAAVLGMWALAVAAERPLPGRAGAQWRAPTTGPTSAGRPSAPCSMERSTADGLLAPVPRGIEALEARSAGDTVAEPDEGPFVPWRPRVQPGLHPGPSGYQGPGTRHAAARYGLLSSGVRAPPVLPA